LLVLAAAAAAFWGAARGAARPADPEPFFFIQISDPQLGFGHLRGDITQDSANLQFAVAAINRLRPAFVVVTGDLVNTQGNAAQIAEYRRVVAGVDSTVPVHHVAGNHDVGNAPTPESLEAYRKEFGPDRYTIRREGFTGIVINSAVAAAPDQVPAEAAAQRKWLEGELRRARAAKSAHLVVFSHHPPYIQDPAEPDGYLNLPREPRDWLLALLARYEVSHLFAGHRHRDLVVQAPGTELVITGSLSRRSTDGPSGLRVVQVSGAGITHRYCHLGELPSRVEPAARW